MKKRTHKCICVALCILLVFSLLCGCGDPAVTSTDITTNEPVITESKNESAVTAENNGDPAESKEESKPETKAGSKPITTAKAKKETAKKNAGSTVQQPAQKKGANSTVQQPAQSGGSVAAACYVQDGVQFYSKEQMLDWFKTGGDFPEKRTKLMEKLGVTNEIRYLWLKEDKLPSDFVLSGIKVNLVNYVMEVLYVFPDKERKAKGTNYMCISIPFLGTAVATKNKDEYWYNYFKNLYESGDKGSWKKTVNGTTYYLNQNKVSIGVDWKQYGEICSVSFCGHEDQENQILEAMNMQPVTVKIEK